MAIKVCGMRDSSILGAGQMHFRIFEITGKTLGGWLCYNRIALATSPLLHRDADGGWQACGKWQSKQLILGHDQVKGRVNRTSQLFLQEVFCLRPSFFILKEVGCIVMGGGRGGIFQGAMNWQYIAVADFIIIKKVKERQRGIWER